MNVCYTAPVFDASGYGEASRNYVKALYEAGINIKVQPVKFTTAKLDDKDLTRLSQELSTRDIPYQIKILHVTPDIYKNYMEKGKYHIGHLFWETDRLPKTWVAACNQMNEIWTGSDYGKQVIEKSGVTVPVFVIPQPLEINPPEVRPYRLPNFPEDGLIFYSIMDWNERKNPRKLIEAYWKEFKADPDDMCLLIKTNKGEFTVEHAKEIIAEVKGWRNSLGWREAPRVFFCTDLLDREGIYRLHETGTVFVSTHRGEGWGRGQAEASVFGNPVISTGYGGIHDYWNMKSCKKVDYNLVPIDKVYNKYYEPGMLWAEADEASLRKHLRWAKDYFFDSKRKRLLKAFGTTGGRITKSLFSFETVGKQMEERLTLIERNL